MTPAENQLIQDAINVQDACNLSGVVHGFSKAVSLLWEYARAHNKGTSWVNCHPVCVLYSNKITQLAGDTAYLMSSKFSWAYQWAQSGPESLEYEEPY